MHPNTGFLRQSASVSSPPVGIDALNYSKLTFILLFLEESEVNKGIHPNMTETDKESQKADQNVPTKCMADLCKVVSKFFLYCSCYVSMPR